jgi:hypothetical protein
VTFDYQKKFAKALTMKLSGITFATLALLPQIATLKCAEIAREGTMVVA